MKANIFLKYIYRASYHMCVCVSAYLLEVRSISFLSKSV